MTPDHPFTRGGLCAKLTHFLEDRVYNSEGRSASPPCSATIACRRSAIASSASPQETSGRTSDHGEWVPYREGGFETASGKAELYSESAATMGLDPLSGWEPAEESPTGAPALVERFPLALITPKHAHPFLNSSYANVERALKAEGSPVLDVHSEDAVPRGIGDGAMVRVFNERGSVELPARVGDRVPPDVAAMPSGWWASCSPNGSSANALTADGFSEIGGGGDFHNTLVQVELAGA